MITSTLLLTLTLASQTAQPPKPDPAEKDFDFWIGKWDAKGKTRNADNTWTDTQSTNSIKRAFDGKVIHESFDSQSFHGESWSVYNPYTKRWHQTWVDNQGSYIALQGGFKDGKMTLTTPPGAKNPQNRNRMVFSNITKEAFDWDWESTGDAGKTWTLQWHIHYTRKK